MYRHLSSIYVRYYYVVDDFVLAWNASGPR